MPSHLVGASSSLGSPPSPTSQTNRTSYDSDDDSEVSSIFERIHNQAQAAQPSLENLHYDETSSDRLLAGDPEKLPDRSHRKQFRTRSIVVSVLSIIIVGCVFFLIGFNVNAHSATSLNSTQTAPQQQQQHAPGYGSPEVDSSKKLFSMKDWRNGVLRPSFEQLEWVAPAPGGETAVHLIEDGKDGFVLVNWPDRSNRTVLFDSSQRSFSFNKSFYLVSQFVLSPDRKHAVLIANIRKNYRHSTFASYFLYDIESKEISTLNTANPSDSIAVAAWSPLADKIAFVQDNNLYVRVLKNGTNDEIKQITTDGGSEIFYGRPDWVYEEEVFGSDIAMWWSPKGDYLAYLRTNDSAVEEFPIPYFVQKNPPSKHPYPQLSNIKYPKPGTPNPIVDLLLLETASFESYHVPVEEKETDPEKLITEVVWTGDRKVIMRITDRESSLLKVGVIDAEKRVGNVSRTVDAAKDGGWFEISQNTHFVPSDSQHGRSEDGYIDMNVIDGYNHLVYYSPVDAATPKAVLTRGEWEVDDAQVAFNPRTNRVYFISTKKSSVERHVYSVNLDGSDLKALTNDSADGWYSASFSPDSRYALIGYKGPDVPWQVVLDLEADDVWGSAIKLSQNDHLKKKAEDFHLPQQVYSQVKVGVDKNNKDVLANAVEYRPPNFNTSLKYPVLFYVYGGPVSQLVQKTFAYSFPHVVASTLNAIVVTVDGRGTGFRGRAFRNVVREHLGRYEAQDQIAAARDWASREYVDPTRLAIWGWSYGGFMTLKTLETDGGDVFRYGMAVAPVTDWRFYDSVYTERYMRLPGKAHNGKGYDESAISNVNKIAQNTRFLIMHGTGDDNVHFQHTLTLLDKFDLAGVENYDVHVFPDSDHSIYYHGANTIVYDKLVHWISDAFSGKFLHFLKKRNHLP